MNRKTRKIIIILVELAVIIALFVYFGFIIAKDYDKFADTISRITIPFFCGLILIQFAKHGVGSLEWLVLLRQAGSRKSFFTLFTARLTGFAISYLTPSLYLGGEPARAAVLNDSTISYKKALASVVLDKYIELFTKLPCIIMGFAFLIIILKPEFFVIFVSTVFIVFFVSLFLFLLIKLFRDKAFIHNFFRIILRPVLKFRPRFAVKVMLVVKEFQSDISTIIKEKKAFYLASGIGFLISLIEVFQSYYIISFLYPTGYSPSMILIFSFIIYFSSLIFSLIPYPTPGGLGPVEGIYVIFFILFGMQRADGLLYSLLLRMGQSVSIGLGLVNLFLRRVFKKRDKIV
jgi:glycosyltransferase 2 family protein